MNKLKILQTAGAFFVGLSMLAAPHLDANARTKKKTKAPTDAPAELETKLKLRPTGLSFGQRRKAVVRAYYRAIERDYKPRWKEVEPGVQMERLRYEIDQAKQRFRLSYQEFDGKPTSLDGSKLRGEYTHNNGEAFMRAKRKGKERYLFFIKGKLWKVIDLYPLKEGAKWGADFSAAVSKIQKVLGGVEGRKLEPNPEEGRMTAEVDFADSNIHLRLMDLGNKLGIAYVDKSTEGRLDSLRKNKGEKKDDVDDSVKSVLR